MTDAATVAALLLVFIGLLNCTRYRPNNKLAMTDAATVAALLLVFGALVAPGSGGYNVTVVTDPRQGPFRLSTSVTLSCRVGPQPPGQVTYSWRTSVQDSGISTANHTSPNTTLVVQKYHLHLGWYFCYAYSNNTLIGVGNTLVETQGFIYTEQSRTQFTPGDMVTLRVNLSDPYGYIRQLTWFHNGTEVVANCNLRGRVTVNTIGTELNITDATSADSGLYTVRVSSLDFYGYHNSRQDSLWLPALEHHTAHAPVTLILMEQGTESDLEVQTTLQVNYCCLEHFMIQHYFESLVISQLLDIIDIHWYHNGTAVDRSRTSSSLEQQREGFTLSLAFFNARNETDLGLYEGVASVYVYHFWLYIDYYDYVSYLLNIRQLQVTSFPAIIHQYKPPSTTATVKNPALEIWDSTTLTCSAVGGHPDNHNITWTKDGNIIASILGNTLNYSTRYSFPNPFGTYICTVDSLYSSEEISILIQEKALLQVQMAFGSIEIECENWTLPEGTTTSVSQAISSIIQDLCDCNVTAANFQNFSLTCYPTSLDTGDLAFFTSSLIYSSDNGSITASMLVDMLEAWLLTSDNISAAIDGNVVEFTRNCLTKPSLPSPKMDFGMVCDSSTDGGAIAGAFIGGLFAGMAIFGAGIGVAVAVWILRWRADPARSTSDAGQRVGGKVVVKNELEMKRNEAYETVHYSEEPVYAQPS